MIKKQAGFTLLELTLSLAIFLAIITLLLNAIVQGLNSRRRTSNNVTLPKIQGQIISDITDNARWAKVVFIPNPNSLEITDHQNENHRYQLDGQNLVKTQPDGSTTTLNPSTVIIDEFVITHSPLDYEPSGFTVKLVISNKDNDLSLSSTTAVSVRIGRTTYPGMPPTPTPTP